MDPLITQIGSADQHVRDLDEILEQGSTSTSLSRRVATYQSILLHAPPSTVESWWIKMLWDPEPYVRSAVYDVLLEEGAFERADILRHRNGLSAAEKCKYALRLHRVHPSIELELNELQTLEDHFYCGLWHAERYGKISVLENAIDDGEFPLMMDFVVDLGESAVDLGSDFEEALLLVEDPFQLPMAAAWLQHHENAIEWWDLERKNADLQRCEEGVDALALFESEKSIDELKTFARIRSICQQHARLTLLTLGEGDIDLAIELLMDDGPRGEQRLAMKGVSRWLEDNIPTRRQRKAWIGLMEIVAQREADGDMQSAAFKVLRQLEASKYVMDKLPNSMWRVQLAQVNWYWDVSAGED